MGKYLVAKTILFWNVCKYFIYTKIINGFYCKTRGRLAKITAVKTISAALVNGVSRGVPQGNSLACKAIKQLNGLGGFSVGEQKRGKNKLLFLIGVWKREFTCKKRNGLDDRFYYVKLNYYFMSGILKSHTLNA